MAITALEMWSSIADVGYGQNGDKPKRRQVKTATPKRRQNWHGQNGDKLKQRQDNHKTAPSQNGDKNCVWLNY